MAGNRISFPNWHDCHTVVIKRCALESISYVNKFHTQNFKSAKVVDKAKVNASKYKRVNAYIALRFGTWSRNFIYSLKLCEVDFFFHILRVVDINFRSSFDFLYSVLPFFEILLYEI